jgi:hypothetical protein
LLRMRFWLYVLKPIELQTAKRLIDILSKLRDRLVSSLDPSFVNWLYKFQFGLKNRIADLEFVPNYHNHVSVRRRALLIKSGRHPSDVLLSIMIWFHNSSSLNLPISQIVKDSHLNLPFESISELAQSIKKLTRQAYPNAPASVTSILCLSLTDAKSHI